MAFHQTLALACLKVQKPQGNIKTPLEALYWHLQGILSHDSLLLGYERWIVKIRGIVMT